MDSTPQWSYETYFSRFANSFQKRSYHAVVWVLYMIRTFNVYRKRHVWCVISFSSSSPIKPLKKSMDCSIYILYTLAKNSINYATVETTLSAVIHVISCNNTPAPHRFFFVAMLDELTCTLAHRVSPQWLCLFSGWFAMMPSPNGNIFRPTDPLRK